MTQKELIEKSYKMGLASFPKYHSAPCLNPNFMSLLPNCDFGDNKGVKLRIKMYKAYSKGWTESYLKWGDST